jgi:hypothetical protein
MIPRGLAYAEGRLLAKLLQYKCALSIKGVPWSDQWQADQSRPIPSHDHENPKSNNALWRGQGMPEHVEGIMSRDDGNRRLGSAPRVSSYDSGTRAQLTQLERSFSFNRQTV